jgi:hypothetical protein
VSAPASSAIDAASARADGPSPPIVVSSTFQSLAKWSRNWRVESTFTPTMPVGSALVKRLLAPVSLGMLAARHLAWYVSYQVSGETRPRS